VSRLLADAARPGFALVTADDVTGAVGFAYGLPGRHLALTAGHRDAWSAAPPFEFCELAVLATACDAGVGAALHDALLAQAGLGPRWLATVGAGAGPAPVTPAPAEHAATDGGVATVAQPEAVEDAITSAQPATASQGGAVSLLLAPGVVKASRVVMGVTMAFMLVITI
jgi:hypothetical protein